MQDKQLKKLLYLFLEAVEKRSADGNLLPEMILICELALACCPLISMTDVAIPRANLSIPCSTFSQNSKLGDAQRFASANGDRNR